MLLQPQAATAEDQQTHSLPQLEQDLRLIIINSCARYLKAAL